MVADLAAHGLQVQHRNTVALQSLDFDLSSGTLAAVVGPNGAGKSTLLACLAGVQKYQGKVLWQNQLLRTLKPQEAAQTRAYLPQKTQLDFALSVQEVIALGAFSFPLTAVECLDKTRQWAQYFGLTHYLNSPYTQLSGGEQQRTQLARIALQIELMGHGPKLVLLDEPFAPLDIYQQKVALAWLQDLAANNTAVLMSVHDLNTAAACDQLLLLHEGCLLQQGSAKRVLQPEHLLEAYGVQPTVIEHPLEADRIMVVF